MRDSTTTALRLSNRWRRFQLERLEDRVTPALAFGVVGGSTLISFDSANPTVITSSVAITGLQASETIQGLDVRPATGQFYALGITNTAGLDEGRVYTLNPATGVLTQVGTTPFSTTLVDGSNYGFDFNPASGGLRVVNNNDQSLRLNANNGALAGTDTALSHPTAAEAIVGVGYDRDFNGTGLTTLFGLDFATDTLVRIGGVDGGPPEGSPNLGVVTTIGSFGVVTNSQQLGFDIVWEGSFDTAYATLTVGGVTSLNVIDLTTGAATSLGTVGTGTQPVASLVVLPDFVQGTVGADVVTVTATADPRVVIASLNGVVQGAFSNTADSTFGVATLAGNDLISIGPGVNLIDGQIFGGADIDTIDYSNFNTPVSVSLGVEQIFRGAATGTQQVPPNGTTATGTVTVIFNTGTNAFDIRIDVTGIALGNLAASHLHSGSAGSNGPVIFDLGDSPDWTVSGANTITRTVNGGAFPLANVPDLINGNIYFNLHTTAFPAGEIRGQLAPTANPSSGTGVPQLLEFENATGGRGNDVLLGDGNTNVLQGGAGDDLLFGKAGTDTLLGQAGNDTLVGGTGNDTMTGGLSNTLMVALDAAGTSLVTFDRATPGTVTITPIVGLPTGKTLFGIDFRPATGQLYGFGPGIRNEFQLYTIDPNSGAAALVGTGQVAPPFQLLIGAFGFDFNPTVDRIRVTSDQEQNFRVNPDTGAIVDGDPGTPGLQGDANLTAGTLVASAYTNNFVGAASTTLFGIDSGTDQLVRQGNPNPNDGVITAIGALGFDTDGGTGFDIHPDGTALATLNVAGVAGLYTINLATGAATLVGTVGGAALSGLAAGFSPGTDNDRLVWNNGDGTDVMDGGAGSDAVEVNGSNGATGDSFTVTPNGTRIRFDRVNFGLFSLDIGTVEALFLNGGAGNDTMSIADLTGIAPGTSVTLSGGRGDDSLTATALPAGVLAALTMNGGADNDTLIGSIGVDTLNGDGGNDSLTGGRGNDAMNGNDGADTLIWNNGDNSDVMEGGAGSDTVQVNGSTGATGDNFTVATNGTRMDFDRTNLVPFSLDIGTSEALDINGLAGNDTVSVSSTTVGFVVDIDGGADDDSITIGPDQAAILGPVTVDGGAGTNSLTVNALSVAAQVTIANGQVGAGVGDDLFAAGASLDFANVQNLTLNLGDDPNSIFVTPSADTAITVNAALPGPGGAAVDRLTIDPTAVGTAVAFGVVSGSGTATFTTADPVSFSGIEAIDPGASISGTVFLDLNGNGTRENGEPIQGGVTIELDRDGQPFATAVSAADGTFTFGFLAGGIYTVTQLVPAGFTQSTAAPADILIATTADVTGVLFGNTLVTGSVSGVVYNDANGDGSRGANETGIAGVTVYLDLNGDNTLNNGEPATTTGVNGSYTLSGPDGATVTVRHQVPFLFRNTQSPAGSVTLDDAAPITGADFGDQPPNTTVTGTVFVDADGNGARDAGEVGFAGVTVFIDVDGNGSLNNEPSTTTAADGSYTLTGPGAGTFTVRQIVPTNHKQTLAPAAVTLDGFAPVSGVDFGDQPPNNTVSGTVFIDSNGNAARDAGEVGFAGVTVFIDVDGNGVPNNEPTTTTAADGSYTLTGPHAGTFKVRQLVPAKHRETLAPAVVTLSGYAAVTGLDFGDQPPNTTVSGAVFVDVNGNFARDAAEVGLAGVTIFLDLDGNGVINNEPTTTTAADGSYTLTAPGAGTFTVRQIVPTGYTATLVPAAVTLDGFAAASGVDFGDLPPPTIIPKPTRYLAVAAGATGGPRVAVYGEDGAQVRSFFAYDPQFLVGVAVATGDVTGDGVDDIVTGAGAGGGSHVKVFNGATGAEVYSFYAYGAAFTGGVTVAAGDVDGDGRADIITGAGPGGGSHVKAFSGATGAEIRSFFAYGATFTGGVTVAAGDLNGDGRADIITGAGAGGGPHVKAFDGVSGAELQSFFAFNASYTGGVFVASGDLDGDGRADIIVGTGDSTGIVRAFDGTTAALRADFTVFADGGARVAVEDFDADGQVDRLLVGQGIGGGARQFGVPGFAPLNDVTLDLAFQGGVYVG